MTQAKKTNIFYYFLWIYFIFNIIGALAISTRIPNFFELYNNKSNSMLPAIHKGDVSVVKTGYNLGYRPGDIIVFYSKINGLPTIITHRIIAIGGNVYITQGDNNPKGQEIVKPRLILGKVIFIIPALGVYFAFLKSAFGIIILIGLPALILLLKEIVIFRKILS